ncbi:hypothetical protein [Streptomyces boluensis]|uniref:Gram-positive cocci surface proteins LPxTG domain-containing protein n=1 Tax=Streptomyces boluensis TaxID=1775135 RepID=A0A964XLS4_9ACTN|nr:hypothetical protein [Streptomyces boluensis]NBE52042.1 hypothetical protein [Streptomyces boluensis]
MLSGAGLVLAASPAQAAETAYKTECIPPAISGMDPVHGTTKVEIKAPAEAKVGDEVEVVWKTTQAASKNPDVIDLQENTVKPTGTIKVGGGQTADLAMEGPRENPPIKKNSPMVLSDMKGKLKLTAPGEITLTPDAYNINVSKPMSTDTKCAPEEDVKSAATIKVTGGDPGGTTGGLPTGLPTGVPTGLPTGLPTGGAAGGGDSGGSDGGADTGGSDSGGSGSGGSSGGGGSADLEGKEVEIPYKCKTPIGDKEATSPVQINAKKSGGNFDLTVKFKKSVMDSPADIPADSVKPSMLVKLGGADKGTVPVEGPTNKEPIKSGDPIEIPDLTGTYKPGADGKSTLSPGVLTVKALGTTTTCTPAKTEVSLEVDTAAQPGGAAGGSAGGSAGGAAGSSGGGLAETGADDNGALRALGLVAGTVILLGGAVFTFMPRHRRS